MLKKITVIIVIFAFVAIAQSFFVSENCFHPEFASTDFKVLQPLAKILRPVAEIFQPVAEALRPVAEALEATKAHAYPPGVGILTKSKNCMACHVNNGPWGEESKTIIDILDATTKKSLKQPDGSFLLEAKRNESKTVFTVIGRTKEDAAEAPYRNAWTYIDPKTIEANTLNKFAPGWECNLQLSCRVVGDKLPEFEGAKLTSLPMTVRPTDAARDGELQLQLMLTKGESVKGNATLGMKGNYFEKNVVLKVIE